MFHRFYIRITQIQQALHEKQTFLEENNEKSEEFECEDFKIESVIVIPSSDAEYKDKLSTEDIHLGSS